MTSPAGMDGARRASPGAARPFDASFERLVAHVGADTGEAEMLSLHRKFEQRTGRFGPDDPWYESRSRAFWDDTMTGRPLGKALLERMDAGDRVWADALGRSHRGLFQSRTRDPGGEVVLADVLTGAELLVHEADEATWDSLARNQSLFDGRVVAASPPVRLALLPGAVFHPEGAEPEIAKVVAAARARAIRDGALLDALLRMELSLRTLSRVKYAYAYRVEALAG